MSYHVLWRAATERRLARLWSTGADRELIAQGAAPIDPLLARDPMGVGESRCGTMRILLVDRLAVYYEVIETDHTVAVFDVWRRRPRKKS